MARNLSRFLQPPTQRELDLLAKVHGSPLPIAIKTGCWYTPLPADHIKVGISRGAPQRGVGLGYRIYRKLAPGPWFNSCATPAEYIARYNADVLDPLDPAQVRDELLALARGKLPVLCCFERPGGPGWGHRSLVSVWFAETLGLVVPELGYEDAKRHPLAPPH